MTMIMYTATMGCCTGRSPGPGIREPDVLLLAAPEPSDVALTTVETMRVASKLAISKAGDLLVIET